VLENPKIEVRFGTIVEEAVWQRRIDERPHAKRE
jgi:hypothetical protein